MGAVIQNGTSLRDDRFNRIKLRKYHRHRDINLGRTLQGTVISDQVRYTNQNIVRTSRTSPIDRRCAANSIVIKLCSNRRDFHWIKQEYDACRLADILINCTHSICIVKIFTGGIEENKRISIDCLFCALFNMELQRENEGSICSVVYVL